MALDRQTYLTKHTGNFPETFQIGGRTYTKVDDLRYGTNPHQPAAYYRPEGLKGSIMDMETLKNGKSGLSQTNLEDISGALNIVKFFDVPACAVMKHVNPSGAAVMRKGETLKDVYIKARDCDARAAFGSVIAFNVTVDKATAQEIMTTFCECVVAPGFDEDALAVFTDETVKLNRQIRILRCGPLADLPRYVGDGPDGARNTMKVLGDGSVVLAAPLLTNVRSFDDLAPASGESKTAGIQVSNVQPTQEQKDDLLAAWYINISVRSNGIVIVRNGQTLAVGTGEQDRVGAVEQAVEKFTQKFTGENMSLEGAVMSSDGFFPFADGLEVAAKAGIKAVVAPSGSLKDADVIRRANELGVVLRHAPERIFSHH